MQDKRLSLANLNKGQRGIVQQIDENLLAHNVELAQGELERRLLEIGIIEGAELQVLHFGLVRRDPIAVRIIDSGMTIAIRRNEAQIIMLDLVG